MNHYILADNQDITREGLISLLKTINPDAVIVVVGSCEELLKALNLHPESVVVLDYTLFNFSSTDHLLNMVAGAEESSWLLFSDELNEIFLRRVLLSDETISVVMKYNSRENIIKALENAANYETYLCDTAESIVHNKTPFLTPHDNLTATEKIILREIALGKMTKEIAWEKSLSFHTVNTHRRNIFRKIGVNNVHEASKYALRAGLIDMMDYYI
ncbi:MAG: response regulator transcription factor [Tannerella sp.]|jgi:DNA-binding NarL/FixJ family response regulator|nr:response regulator transcription factor [Tannerella sp.]